MKRMSFLSVKNKRKDGMEFPHITEVSSTVIKHISKDVFISRIAIQNPQSKE